MNYQDYLKTDYWKAVSDAVKKRADYRCQLCNSQHDLCAHHRTYEHRGRELEHLSDLTCLCRRCHEIFHGKQSPQTKPIQEISKKKPVIIRDFDREMPKIPEGYAIVLTQELIARCLTKRGAFTNATINALGVNSLVKGWNKRLVGKIVSADDYRKALEGRFIMGDKLVRNQPQSAPISRN